MLLEISEPVCIPCKPLFAVTSVQVLQPSFDIMDQAEVALELDMLAPELLECDYISVSVAYRPIDGSSG